MCAWSDLFFCRTGDETGTKVPSFDLEMPQHDYDEVAMDRAANIGRVAAIKITDSEPDEVCMLYNSITCLRLCYSVLLSCVHTHTHSDTHTHTHTHMHTHTYARAHT